MKYKVKALTVSGLSKKIHRSGDEVNDNDFPVGRAKELVKNGFLVEVADKNTDEILQKNTNEISEKNTAIKQEVKSENDVESPKNIIEEMRSKSGQKKSNHKK